MTTPLRPVLLNSCARAATAEEARFRIDRPIGGRRAVVVALDDEAADIVDRTKERLVSSDTGIIKARQKLKKAVDALRDEGVTPPGVDPEHHRIRSAAIVLPQEESFIESSRDALAARAGVAHTSV